MPAPARPGFRSASRAYSRAELIAGLGRHGLDQGIRDGVLVRARRDVYVAADTPESFVRAARVGGRLTCLSLLQQQGVFVHSNAQLHVHLPSSGGRLRDPDVVGRPLERRARRGVVRHWQRLTSALPDDGLSVHPVDALAHAVLCQTPRHAVASIDSALHTGFIAARELDRLFAVLPAKYRRLRALVDGRAESGPETLMRLMLRALGCRIDLQVEFDRVGRVDFVVDGWLVIECDSKQFHSDWEQQVTDRARDLELAKRGYVTLRFLAAHILYTPHEVAAALRGVLAARG